MWGIWRSMGTCIKLNKQQDVVISKLLGFTMDLNIVTLNSDPFHILNKTHPWGTISIHRCPLISLPKHLHCAGHWRLSPNPEGPLRIVIRFYEIKWQLIRTFFLENVLSQTFASNLGGCWVTHEADP